LIERTINQRGLLHVRATKLALTPCLQISSANGLKQAQGSKAPIQRFSRSNLKQLFFVPSVLVIAALTFIGLAIIGNVDCSRGK